MVSQAKRQRQKDARRARLEEARIAEARRKRRRQFLYLAGAAVLVLVVLFVASRGGDDDGEDVSSATSTSSTEPGTPSTVAITIPAAGDTITGETPCPAADGSSPRTTTFAQPPPMCIDMARTYTAEVATSEGNFSIQLADDTSPQTVNNFVTLARYHFFDGVAFHRIIPGFMNQTGDATGPSPGTGSPGYSIPDELPTGETPPYPEGTVAMANSGPNTAGSQWFVVVGTGGDGLPPNYSPFGIVTSGIEVVQAINTAGDAATGEAGTPTREVIIQSVTISEA